MSNRRLALWVPPVSSLALCLLTITLLLPNSRLGAEGAAPTSWTWAAGPTLNQPRYNHTANLLPDGRVVVIGGITDTNSGTANALPGLIWFNHAGRRNRQTDLLPSPPRSARQGAMGSSHRWWRVSCLW